MLAKHHHLPDACGLAHCVPLVIAELSLAHQLSVALALLSRFGYLLLIIKHLLALELIPAALAQEQLYQQLGVGCPPVGAQHWRAEW